MKKNKIIIFAYILIFCANSQLGCTNKAQTTHNIQKQDGAYMADNQRSITPKKVICADANFESYIHKLLQKKVAVVTNQSAVIEKTHLIDTLISQDVNIVKIFAPEHGFRGNIDRGKNTHNYIDPQTGIPIISLFGKNKRPNSEQLKDVDIVLFDIQDVGARFFTYISTMHEVMEACALNGTEFMVLDRPNPLGDQVDGPVLKKGYESFVGKHHIPVVHGLTVGELALMINGENWLENGKCKLQVIKIKNWDHTKHYSLKIKPSPNLTNDLSIRLYPSLCFFEATKVSIGRGTDFPFQMIGYPDSILGDFFFIPQDKKGMQLNPVQENNKCYGIDLRQEKLRVKFSLEYFISFYQKLNKKTNFFARPKFFNLLAGNNTLIEKIRKNYSYKEIKASWEEDLKNYKIMRKKYLLYKDFE